MRAARFVGRIGGLAVALGVGAAVSLGAPAAWADDPGGDGSEGSSTTSTAPGENSESQDAPTTTGDRAGTPTDSGDTSASGSSSGTAAKTRATASTGALVRRALPGIVRASGGAHSSTKPDNLRAAVNDVVEALTSGAPPKTLPRGMTRGRTNRHQRSVDDADMSAVTYSPPSRPESSTPRPSRVVDLTDMTTVTRIVAPVHITLPAPTRITPQIASVADTKPVPSLSTAVLNALAATGLGPQASNGPQTPVDSPLTLAMFAIGARSRLPGSSFNGQSVETAQPFTALTAEGAAAAPPRFVSRPPIAVGTNPSAVVISADGRMFVANTGSASVSVINTANGQRIDANPNFFSTDISVGTSPSALALSPDGKRLYVANTGSGTVSVIDTATYKRIDANPSFFSQDISVNASPSALAIGAGGRLYVANRGSGTVSVINTANNTLIDVNTNTSGVQSISVGTAPTALALGADGRLYVVNQGNGTVSVINTATYGLTNTIAVGNQPSSAALGLDGRLYVANSGAGTVSVINTATSTVIDANPDVAGTNPITVGPSPSSVALSPDGKFVYVTNGNDTVSVIDTATYAVVGTVAIDTDTTGGHVVAVSPNGTVYITDAADRTVRVLAIRLGNAAPTAGTPTVGTPTESTGAVTGALNFTDADGDTLSYSVTQPSTGTVSITSAGTYTFTPTSAARVAAAAGGPTSITFIVTATDGQASTPVSVTVPIAAPIAATAVTTIGGVSLPGVPLSTGPVMSADGTRGVITTRSFDAFGTTTTQVAVVNTTTGKQVGRTVTIVGKPATTVLSGDGTRALVMTSIPNPTTGISTTRVTVINTTTGTQVGNTVSVAGSPAGIRFLGADGKRALILTDVYDEYDWDGTEHITGVAVIDTTTGAQIGTTLAVSGSPLDSMASVDGSRALVTTSLPNPTTNIPTTRVTMIDTSTGTQSKMIADFVGNRYSAQLLNGNATRVLITTTDGDWGTGNTRVAVLDTITGTQTETVLVGDATGLMFNADGSRALITTRTYDRATGAFTTQLAAIDTATGAQTGSTMVLDYEATVVLSADRTRAVVITSAADSVTETSTQVSVFDLATGTQVGTSFTLAGGWSISLIGADYSTQLLNADGSRALITRKVIDPSTGAASTQVAVIDTVTGRQSGDTITVAGGEFGSALVSTDGSRALIVTNVYDGRTSVNTTRLTVIDTTTCTQVGSTTTMTGFLNGPVLFNADSRRAVVTTSTPSTQVVVIDTTTGTQVGAKLGYGGSGLVRLSADGTRLLVATGSQLAVINTATGTQAGSAVAGGGYPLFSPDGTRALIVTKYNPTRVNVLRVT